jgi:hypothetical protein
MMSNNRPMTKAPEMTDLSHFADPATMHRTALKGTKLQAVQAVGWPLIRLVTVLLAGCVSLPRQPPCLAHAPL